MNRKAVLGCVVPLALAAGLTWWGMHTLTHADPPAAHYSIVDRGDVEVKVTETGTIEPLKKVEVKSKVAGRVAKLYVQEGDHVRAGQALAEIDPTEINSQVAQMQAQLDATRARYEQAKKGFGYQKDQTVSGVRQAEQALRSAEARLRVAQEEEQSQPGMTAGDIAQAEAALKSAQDSLSLMKSATHPQAVVAAQSGADEANASAENARRNLDRQLRLLDKGFVAEQVVDAARADLASAKARRDQAVKKLELIQEQNRLELAGAQNQVNQAQAALDRARAGRSIIPVKKQETLAARAAMEQARDQLRLATQGDQQDRMRQDDIRAAAASVVQLENQLREVQVHQSDTHLVSTADGTVTRRYIEEGELVTSGVSTFSSGTPVMQVADLSKMLVKMTVNEVDVHKVNVGLPVEISIDGVKDVLFNGRVTKVAPAAVGAANPGGDNGQQGGQQNPGGVIRFAVEVLVDRPDSRLKPGMSARCNIIIARRRNVLRLPSDCVEGSGAAAKVQIVTAGSKDGKPADTFTTRTVNAGLRGDSHVEIVSGLKRGDRVKPGKYTGPERKGVEMEMN